MLRVIALVFALYPAAAAAQSSCGGQTQIDANFCAKERWEAADRELNRLWKQVKPVADARGTGRALLAEQRAWLKRRDASCEPELHSGGSAAHMFYWACMEEETLMRNHTLRAMR
ncbi:lysozyme inhibitor LprI family protein [Roseobacteraceae bacterium NS-SX3]